MLSWLGKLLRTSPQGVSPQDESNTLVHEALACREAGRFEAAERYLYRALALEPGSAEIQLQLGDLFRQLGRYDAALNCCLEAVRLAPELPQGRNNLGNAYRNVGQLDAAVAEYRRAIALDGSLAEAHFNLGVANHQRGDAPGAMQCFRKALQSRPGFADAHLNLGFLLEEVCDFSGAIESYRRAAAEKPELVEAHVNLGMQLLLAGRFAEGWNEYEWRLRYPEYGGADVAATAVRWEGAVLESGTILLDAEQGFGDAIQFLRYAPLVAERADRVLVRCAPELTGLFRSTPGVAEAVSRREMLPSFDAYCPLPSLPRVFGTTLETVPARVPYVFPDREKADYWKTRLADGEGWCKVGLAWASQSKHRTSAAKSVALDMLAPLAEVPGMRFYSLQKGEAARQAERPPAGMRIVDLAPDLNDFADTAAVIANLDLVISVDTAVAHLAGAMARPAWTLLKVAPDWRWLLAREDCPWYPTMRLFRQEHQGDWGAVIAALVAALRRFGLGARQGL